MIKFISTPSKSKTCGLYKITNTANGKFYIGSSKQIEYRFYEHRKDLRKNQHINKLLQNAWNKYGESAFTFEVIEECKIEELIEKEQNLLNEFQTANKNFGYNICEIADRPVMTQSVRDKISETLKGNIPWNLGKPHSEEVKQKMRKAKEGIKGSDHPRFGKSHSEETKNKIRVSNQKYQGENHNWYGKNHSEETKNKIKLHQIKNSKPVVQIHKNKIIARYDSIAEAERATGIKDTISRCVNGKQLTAGGYQWEFLDSSITGLE